MLLCGSERCYVSGYGHCEEHLYYPLQCGYTTYLACARYMIQCSPGVSVYLLFTTLVYGLVVRKKGLQQLERVDGASSNTYISREQSKRNNSCSHLYHEQSWAIHNIEGN